MKSVLHVALIAPNGYSNQPIMNAFLDNGYTSYHCFDYQLQMFEYGKETMRKNLLKLAMHTKPDLIFLHVQSSEILDYDTVIQLSNIGFTVLYTFDCRTTEQTEWMYNYSKHLGLVCFSNQDDVQECLRRGITNTICVQSSCYMELYHKIEVAAKHGAVFIGGNYVGTNLNFPLDTERVVMVDRLTAKFGDKFHVMGMGWGKNSTLVQPREEMLTYNKAEIAISHNNFNKRMYTSDRLWRIMACGAFCLTRYFDGIEQMFIRGVHLDWWHTMEELEEKINFWFENAETRDRVAKNGMIEVRKNHRWSDRIKTIIDRVRVLKPTDAACRDAHRVNGELPLEERHGGTVCDCGKFKFSWAECGCGEKKMEIRMEQNI